MYEMELAAKIIIDKINEHHSIINEKGIDSVNGIDVPVYLRLFKTDEEQTGFLHLIEYGWLSRRNYNGEFKPNKFFFDRISLRNNNVSV